MTELVFLLEEESARAMLEAIVPRLLPQEVAVRYMVFEGKQDLDGQLERRLRGYRNRDAAFVVLRDLDREPDCRRLKQSLAEQCRRAGRPEAVVRIACCELEAFYLADLKAVEKALDRPRLANLQVKRRYREPDRIVRAYDELRRLTDNGYQRISGSRAIAPHLDLDNERSPSFAHLIASLRRLALQLRVE